MFVIPPDTDGFLAMLNSNPFIAESEFTARAYYATHLRCTPVVERLAWAMTVSLLGAMVRDSQANL